MFLYCVLLRRVVAAAILGLSISQPARGEDVRLGPPLPDGEDRFAGRVEMSNGFDVTGTSWSAYSTAVFAPFGPLTEDGLRLKLYGSYGTWSYDTRRVYCPLTREEQKKLAGVSLKAECDALANRQLSANERKIISQTIAPFGLQLDGDQIYHAATHDVTRYDIAVMSGFQVSWRDLALKAYLGPAMETRAPTPPDLDKALDGTYWGAKTAIESWMAIGSSFWLTVDGTYFTGTDGYSTSLRLGYQPLSWLTLGPEMAAFGDKDDESTRAGGFLRFIIGKTEATLSGGISSDYGGMTSAYGQAGVYTRF
jgi:hypothetical protein